MTTSLLERLPVAIGGATLAAPSVSGVLTRITGLLLTARGVRVPLGAYCEVVAEHGEGITCEVVGFDGEEVQLMPLATVQGLAL